MHPAKLASSLKNWQEYWEAKEKHFPKKTSQKACQRQKSLLLLHPLTERLAKQKKRHVPRHIELTAVLVCRDVAMQRLKRIKTNIKRVRESKDLIIPLELESNNNSLSN